MTTHAINPLARLSKYEFVDAILAHFAFEAIGMVGVVASHNGFVKYGEMTYVTTI